MYLTSGLLGMIVAMSDSYPVLISKYGLDALKRGRVVKERGGGGLIVG